jgi:hypothetical protein
MSISLEEHIKVLERRRSIDQEVIRAMQKKLSSRWNPIKDLLYRKPWRSRIKYHQLKGDYWWITIINIWGWLCRAHDCQDPSIGCSCSGGFRFP